MRELIELLPTSADYPLILPIFVIVFSLGYICGYLKTKNILQTGYTRKIFHLSIFTIGYIFSELFDIGAVVILGSVVTIYGLIIIFLGDGNILYEGLAREKDRPYRTFYLIVPFIAASIGSLINNILFSNFASLGYMIVGWGDASGEPVGVMFGKHRYRVPAIIGVRSERSLEGSIAVMLTTITILIFTYPFSWYNLIVFIFVGCVTMFVEAISPHGLDNLTVQVIPVYVLSVMFKFVSGY